jgi:hypothetical protein
MNKPMATLSFALADHRFIGLEQRMTVLEEQVLGQTKHLRATAAQRFFDCLLFWPIG